MNSSDEDVENASDFQENSLKEEPEEETNEDSEDGPGIGRRMGGRKAVESSPS